MIKDEILREFFVQNISISKNTDYTTISSGAMIIAPDMTMNDLNITVTDGGLEKIFEALNEYCNTNEERELRHQHRALQDAWEKYQMVLKLVK